MMFKELFTFFIKLLFSRLGVSGIGMHGKRRVNPPLKESLINADGEIMPLPWLAFKCIHDPPPFIHDDARVAWLAHHTEQVGRNGFRRVQGMGEP